MQVSGKGGGWLRQCRHPNAAAASWKLPSHLVTGEDPGALEVQQNEWEGWRVEQPPVTSSLQVCGGERTGSLVSSSLAAGALHFPGAWDPPLQTGAVWVTVSPHQAPPHPFRKDFVLD